MSTGMGATMREQGVHREAENKKHLYSNGVLKAKEKIVL